MVPKTLNGLKSGKLKNETSINLPRVKAENDSLKVWLLIIAVVVVHCTKMAEKELVVLVILLCCLLVLQQTNLVEMDLYSRTYAHKCLLFTQIMDSNRIKRHKWERRERRFWVGQFHEWCGCRRRTERKF